MQAIFDRLQNVDKDLRSEERRIKKQTRRDPLPPQEPVGSQWRQDGLLKLIEKEVAGVWDEGPTENLWQFYQNTLRSATHSEHHSRRVQCAIALEYPHLTQSSDSKAADSWLRRFTRRHDYKRGRVRGEKEIDPGQIVSSVIKTWYLYDELRARLRRDGVPDECVYLANVDEVMIKHRYAMRSWIKRNLPNVPNKKVRTKAKREDRKCVTFMLPVCSSIELRRHLPGILIMNRHRDSRQLYQSVVKAVGREQICVIHGNDTSGAAWMSKKIWNDYIEALGICFQRWVRETKRRSDSVLILMSDDPTVHGLSDHNEIHLESRHRTIMFKLRHHTSSAIQLLDTCGPHKTLQRIGRRYSANHENIITIPSFWRGVRNDAYELYYGIKYFEKLGFWTQQREEQRTRLQSELVKLFSTAGRSEVLPKQEDTSGSEFSDDSELSIDYSDSESSDESMVIQARGHL